MRLEIADLYYIVNILWDIHDEADPESYDRKHNHRLLTKIQSEILRRRTSPVVKIGV